MKIKHKTYILLKTILKNKLSDFEKFTGSPYFKINRILKIMLPLYGLLQLNVWDRYDLQEK